MKRTTFEILVREVVGAGVLPVRNPFGRQVIGARKKVSNCKPGDNAANCRSI